MNIESLSAFSTWLRKEASVPPSLLRGVGRFVSETPARTALLGAAGGAMVGGATNEDHLSGALGGAWRGAIAGGVAGGAGRVYRDARLLNPQLSGAGALAKHVGGELADFGKRTLHGLTGTFTPSKIGITSSGAALKEGDLILRRAQDQLKHVSDPAERQQIVNSAMESVRAARKAGQEGERAIELGVTSLPGTVKALVGKDRGEAARYLGKQMIGGGGATGVLMGVGLPLGFGAYDLVQGDESGSGGRTIPQKLVNIGAGTATGALMGGMPLGSQLAAQMGIDQLVMPKVMDVTKNLTRRSAQPVPVDPGEGPGRLPVT